MNHYAEGPAVLGDLTVFISLPEGDPSLGLVIAKHFVRQGVQRLGVIGTDEPVAEEVSRELFTLASGIWSLSAAGDTTDPVDAQRVCTELSRGIGEPDVLIQCLPPLSATGSVRPGGALVFAAAEDPPTSQLLAVNVLSGTDSDPRPQLTDPPPEVTETSSATATPQVVWLVTTPAAASDDVAGAVLDICAGGPTRPSQSVHYV